MEKLLKKIRNQTFWIKDWKQGGKIKKHYDDVKYQYFNSDVNSTILKRKNDLNSLLNHAVQTVEFYKDIDVLNGIYSFPIINKNNIKNNKEKFFSSVFKNEKLTSTTTSGSTGTPFTVFRDKNKLKRHHAENIFFSEIAGYTLGSRLYYLRVWNKVNEKSFFSKFLQNIKTIEISNLSDLNINNFLRELEHDNSEKSILSFSSSLEIIAKFIQQKRLDYFNVKINCIITMSEPITSQAKKILENYFNCPVISRYSNMENGFIAQQESKTDKYIINQASFFIEIFDIENDEILPDNELGRIVITDLFNYAMPLIRYDTGDLGILKTLPNGHAQVLSSIEGRRVDFIKNTKNQLLSPHAITNTMWKFSDVLQFQFVQKNKREYLMKINIANEFYDKEDLLIADLKKYLGTDAEVQVEIVHEIPLLSSGKRKKIINLMQHSQ